MRGQGAAARSHRIVYSTSAALGVLALITVSAQHHASDHQLALTISPRAVPHIGRRLHSVTHMSTTTPMLTSIPTPSGNAGSLAAFPARAPSARRRRSPIASSRACEQAVHTGDPAGLTHLVGDRSPLSPAPEDAAYSAAWNPDATWYGSQNMTSYFGTCAAPDPADCDEWYSKEMTAAVQAALWASQNPADCGTARYLVLLKPWPSGFGSSLHIHMYMLAIAIRDNRILVPAPDLAWRFAAPELCSRSSRPGSRPHNYFDCYFLPTTRCSLPPDWRTDTSRNLTSLGMADRIVTTTGRTVLPFWGVNYKNLRVESEAPVLHAHKDKPSHWWYAQLAKFVLRPSDFTLRQVVWPLQLGAFYRTEGALPHPLAAVFIRAGDKFREAPLQSVDAHFAELAPIAARLGIKDVYIGSDSHDRIAEAVTKYGSKYTMHFIEWGRPQAGVAVRDVELAVQTGWQIDELVRLSLANMYITAQADVVVGTLSSNVARLADEFRRATGKARVPYLNPETPLRNASSNANL